MTTTHRRISSTSLSAALIAVLGARVDAEVRPAVPVIIDTDSVKRRPRELTIIAIGPLTNLAIALRSDPGFAAGVKQLVIMGGAVAALPDGAGNQTPNAEFNFWAGTTGLPPSRRR
jgi:inosine-uridine nucleoside N-ribohydrolase